MTSKDTPCAHRLPSFNRETSGKYNNQCPSQTIQNGIANRSHPYQL